MEEKFSDELDIKTLFNIFRKRWKWLAVSTACGFLVLLLVSLFALPRQYTSSVSLYVNNLTLAAISGDVNINDINASQKLVNTYIVILQDDDVLNQIGSKLSTPMSAAQLSGILKMGAMNQTEVLQISAETTDPQLSAEICNMIAEVAPSVLQRVVKAGSVEVIGSAKPARSPSSPDVTRNSAIGAMLGLLLAVAMVLIAHFFDTTVKGEEDLKARFDIPVLGEIPSFDSQENHNKNKYGKYERYGQYRQYGNTDNK